ncbi:MAG: DUF58 domain-containing protein [Sulfurimicrobium sp.]|nr:DUF58 domain-containing protein [Sulfurimicrobium sp.]
MAEFDGSKRRRPSLRIPFLERVLRPAQENGPVILTQGRLYILPTRHGLIYALMLLVMLLGAINYANSMGLVLTFLLASLAVVSILHTYRNLAQLRVEAGKADPAFAGQEANFHLLLDNPSTRPRFAIGLGRGKSTIAYSDIAAGNPTRFEFSVPATERGLLHPGRFSLFSTFPLGLFRVWAHLNLDMSCLVYPRPAVETMPLPLGNSDTLQQGQAQGDGQDDFSGLRGYRTGDGLRHVAWKAVAQERGMLTKQFSGEAAQEIWLDWDSLPGMDTEARLSRLTRWVLDADRAGLCYGLKLPGLQHPPAHGREQMRRCLQALALFGHAP